jgi:hypothetical protein
MMLIKKFDMKKYIVLLACLLGLSKAFCQELIGKTRPEVNAYADLNGGVIDKREMPLSGEFDFPVTILMCKFPNAVKESTPLVWIMIYMAGDTCFKYKAMYALPEPSIPVVEKQKASLIAKYDKPGSGYTRKGKELLWHSDKNKLDVELTTVWQGGIQTRYFMLNVSNSDKRYSPSKRKRPPFTLDTDLTDEQALDSLKMIMLRLRGN